MKQFGNSAAKLITSKKRPGEPVYLITKSATVKKSAVRLIEGTKINIITHAQLKGKFAELLRRSCVYVIKGQTPRNYFEEMVATGKTFWELSKDEEGNWRRHIARSKAKIHVAA